MVSLPAFNDTRIPASCEISTIVEILTLVADLCNWTTLVQFGNCNCLLRAICQRAMHNRIGEFLAPFVGNDNDFQARLFNILTRTNAAITGPLVHIMLSSFSDPIYRSIRPKQLDIAVPYTSGNDAMGIWIRFFKRMQYEVCYDQAPDLDRCYLAKRTLQMKRQVRSMSLHE